MRRIAEENPYAEFLLRNGNRVMIKRKLFEKIVDEVDEV